MALQITYRIDRAAAAPVKLQLACSDKTCASLDVSGLFARAQTGAWSTVAIRLACFGAAPADLSQVTAPFMISTHGPFGLSFAEVSIVPDTGKAVCP
jgi:beta-glucosidase